MFAWTVLFLLRLLSLYHISQNQTISEDKKPCRTLNNTKGTCTLLTNCNTSKHIVEERDDNECPINNICCSSIPTNLLNNNSQYDLLPFDCGISSQGVRITNGDNAELFEFPWQVGLKYATNYTNPFLCGGTLINNRYVLTAAHCIKTNWELIAVRLGEYDFNSNPDCFELGRAKICAPKYIEIPVNKNDAVVHEKYSDSRVDHDIGLIRLPNPIEFNENIMPICLPINKYAEGEFNKLTVIGWGYTEYEKRSSILQKVTVPNVDISLCKRMFPRQFNIDEKQLCAGGTHGKDSCKGDSGGPIMYPINDNGEVRWVQVGLVSFGEKKCGSANKPAVYTRLTAYIDWILSHIKL